MNTHISIPPSAADAYRAILAEQEYSSLEEAASFYRIPSNVIGNELYTVTRDLKMFADSQMNGNDFDVKSFSAIIGKLNKIKSEAKSFKSEDEVPVSYVYTKK
jgi:hypothetical protein